MDDVISKRVYEVQEKINQYISGELKYSDIKKFLTSIGMYKQNDKNFLIRVRITGGEITLEELKKLREIIKRFDIPYFRITTRQNIQIHDIPPEKINDILNLLMSEGFMPRGGCGDTFRSIPASYNSGISKDSLFNVIPYAQEITKMMFPLEKAFNLPRKLKIAFSSSKKDLGFAKWQDLGFIAAIDEERKKGFEVYIGGGIGRKSKKALKAFDFIPAKDCFKCALAMLNLFYENGNWENRSRARIRFMREDLGDEGFKKLFVSYFKSVKTEKSDIENTEPTFNVSKETFKESENSEKSQRFFEWQKALVEDTKWENLKLVKVPIPQGNLNRQDIDYLLNIFEQYSLYKLRFTRTHHICFVVNKKDLVTIYNMLEEYSDKDFIGRTFRNHILSCIGSDVCSLGQCNAKQYSNIIADTLDKTLSNEIKIKFFDKIKNAIGVSGCFNSCANIEACKIGVTLTKKKQEKKLIDNCNIKLFSSRDEEQSYEEININGDNLEKEFTKLLNNIDFKKLFE